jgi:hypothetical protein
MLKAVNTFSASSSLSPPYRCSNASISEREEAVLVDRNIRDLPVGASSGKAEWEDVRRTVAGASVDPDCRGEGVLIEADLEVSGESILGNRGARYQLIFHY